MLLLATPRPAFAHLHLHHAEPAADATLTTVPHEIRLEFTERPQLAISAIALTGPDGASITLGPLALDPSSPRTLVAPIVGALRAGSYTVTWRAASPDGHPMRGHYSFTVASGASGLPVSSAATAESAVVAPQGAVSAAGSPAPSTAAAAAQQIGSAGALDVSSPLYAAVRWLGYAALLAIIGAVALALVVVPRVATRAPDTDPAAARARLSAARLAWVAAWVLLVDVVLRLIAQSYAVSGSGGAWRPAAFTALVTGTVWGWGWMLEGVAALLALVSLAIARREGTRGWGLAALAAAAAAFSMALSGHAVATPGHPALLVVADALHVTAAGGWLGTLLVVAVAGIPAAFAAPEGKRGRAVAEIVNAFSPVALACAALLVLTGLIAAWVHLGALDALLHSDYGRTLLIKLGAVVLLAALGAVNWRVLRPALGDEPSARRIRRSATAELVLGAVVLAITAVLVATPPPAEQSASAPTRVGVVVGGVGGGVKQRVACRRLTDVDAGYGACRSGYRRSSAYALTYTRRT